MPTTRASAVLGAVVLGAWLVGCEEPAGKDASTSASAPAAPATAAPVATPAATPAAPEKKPVHPCPEGSTGVGTFEKPCKATGKTRIMEVSWNGKIGDKGPTFKVISKSSLEILYGMVVVYFYDKAGKQLESAGEKPKKKLVCPGNIFAGPIKPSEKAFFNFSCVRKDDVPAAATAIEAEMQMVGFTDDTGKSDTYWRNDDLAPDERPKGGVK
jgi:hypothetical protein